MNLLRLLIFAFLLVCAPAQAASPEILVKTRLDPAADIVVGQPVNLFVEVLFPDQMPHPPRVVLADAPGAQILRFETQAVTTRERVGEVNYVGQVFTFVVFPRRGGGLDIPAADVTLLDRNGDPIGSAKGEAEHIDVEVPDGLDASGPVLAASAVTITQTWSPEPVHAALRPGAAIERTIRRQATGVPALGMADFVFSAPEGIRVYVDPPQADDHVNRGDVAGSRTDKVTYVFEKAGSYDLPALSQPWWDMGRKQARTQVLAGVHVTVTPVPASERSGAFPWRSLLSRVGLVLASFALVLAALVAAAARWSAWRQRYAASDASARRTLCRIARTGDARETYRALLTWLGRLPPGVANSVRSDPRLQPAISALAATLFGTASIWSAEKGRDLAGQVMAVHRLYSGSRHESSALPPLNPQPKGLE
jgi:hypothetical protein